MLMLNSLYMFKKLGKLYINFKVHTCLDVTNVNSVLF